jgi:iron(III) transport system ATP-binding protein
MKRNMGERHNIHAEPLLRAEGLVRHFPAAPGAAVADATFHVEDGELLALLGPSGCGKTTTLRMVGGFERPDAGKLFLNGRDITAQPPEKRGIGFVFQDYALFPHLSVYDNVKFGLRGRPVAEARERTHAMLDLIGMSAFAARMPHELSGGQQQRVALARTLAVAPRLVLLDEPFSNLDAAMRVETRQEVRSLLKKAGSAAVLVTHDQEEALALADRVAVMRDGRIRQIGTPDDVYRFPADEFIARFLGRSNIVEAQAAGRIAQTRLGTMTLTEQASGPVRIAIRPEQILLTPVGAIGSGQSPGDVPSGVIVGREFRGHDQLYWVETAGTSLMALAGCSESLAIGTTVSLTTSEPVVVIRPD